MSWWYNIFDYVASNHLYNYDGSYERNLPPDLLRYIHRQAISRPKRKLSQQGWTGSALADYVAVYCRQDLATVVRVLAATDSKLYVALGNATSKTYKDQHQALVEAGFYGALPNVSK